MLVVLLYQNKNGRCGRGDTGQDAETVPFSLCGLFFCSVRAEASFQHNTRLRLAQSLTQRSRDGAMRKEDILNFEKKRTFLFWHS